MNPLFGSIKEENIVNVFDAFLARKVQTRRNVEATTGLSFVTVSKVADALVELKILRQYNLTADSLPRRSRVLVTKQYYWIGVYLFSPHMFSFIAYDLSFKEVHRYDYRPNILDLPDQEIYRFIYMSQKFIKKNRIKMPRCISLGVLVPGDYDSQKDKITYSHINHFSAFHFKSIFSQYFPNEIIRVASIYESCAEELRYKMSPEEKIFSLFVEKDSVRSAYITKLYPPLVRNTGILRSSTGMTFNALAHVPQDVDPFFNDLREIIFTLDYTVSVTKVAIGGNLYPRNSAVATVLHHLLAEKYHKMMKIPPDVLPIDIYQAAIKNITREMRNKWFREKIIHQIPYSS